MKRRDYFKTAGRWAALLAGAWALSGCTLMRLREAPRVDVVGLESLPREGMELRLAVKLRVQNPNDVALDFDGLSFTLDLSGARLASGVSAEHVQVPRFGESVISVPVSVSALALARLIAKLASKEHHGLDYELHGSVNGLGLGDLHFKSTGEVALPKGLGTH